MELISKTEVNSDAWYRAVDAHADQILDIIKVHNELPNVSELRIASRQRLVEIVEKWRAKFLAQEELRYLILLVKNYDKTKPSSIIEFLGDHISAQEFKAPDEDDYLYLYYHTLLFDNNFVSVDPGEFKNYPPLSSPQSPAHVYINKWHNNFACKTGKVASVFGADKLAEMMVVSDLVSAVRHSVIKRLSINNEQLSFGWCRIDKITNAVDLADIFASKVGQNIKCLNLTDHNYSLEELTLHHGLERATKLVKPRLAITWPSGDFVAPYVQGLDCSNIVLPEDLELRKRFPGLRHLALRLANESHEDDRVFATRRYTHLNHKISVCGIPDSGKIFIDLYPQETSLMWTSYGLGYFEIKTEFSRDDDKKDEKILIYTMIVRGKVRPSRVEHEPSTVDKKSGKIFKTTLFFEDSKEDKRFSEAVIRIKSTVPIKHSRSETGMVLKLNKTLNMREYDISLLFPPETLTANGGITDTSGRPVNSRGELLGGPFCDKSTCSDSISTTICLADHQEY